MNNYSLEKTSKNTANDTCLDEIVFKIRFVKLSNKAIFDDFQSEEKSL